MTVKSIKRDWGADCDIIRIVTDNTFNEVTEGGWFAQQIPTINQLNNGNFEFLNNDTFLVTYQNQARTINLSNLFNRSPDGISLVAVAPLYGNTFDLVPHAGGGQTNATLLQFGVNRIDTVATTGDSLKLTADVRGVTIIVFNKSGNSLNVFPFEGSSINNLSANTAIAVPADSQMMFIGASLFNWITFAGP